MLEFNDKANKTFQKDMTRLNKGIDQQVPKWLKRWGVLLSDKARTKLKWWNPPSGGRYMGHLADSISAEAPRKMSNAWQMVWGAGASYARFVEGYPKPPREHFLPFKHFPEIKRWCKRHGFNVDNMWGLKVGGEKSTHPFMQPTLQEKRQPMASDFVRFFGRLLHGT